jgi:hypothetical protein
MNLWISNRLISVKSRTAKNVSKRPSNLEEARTKCEVLDHAEIEKLDAKVK